MKASIPFFTLFDQFVYSSSNWALLLLLAAQLPAKEFGQFALTTAVWFGAAAFARSLVNESTAVTTSNSAAPSTRLILQTTSLSIPVFIVTGVLLVRYTEVTDYWFTLLAVALGPIVICHELLRSRYLLLCDPRKALLVNFLWLLLLVLGFAIGSPIATLAVWTLGLAAAVSLYGLSVSTCEVDRLPDEIASYAFDAIALRALPVISLTVFGLLGSVEEVGTFRLSQTFLAPLYLSLGALFTLSLRSLKDGMPKGFRIPPLLLAGFVFVFVCYGGILVVALKYGCLLYTSPSPRDRQKSRMPSSA